jgi:TonB-linked SusC/RagA family outer membrane protein
MIAFIRWNNVMSPRKGSAFKLKIVLWIFLLLIQFKVAYAQNIVSGTIKDAGGQAMPGVSIKIKNTNTGTISEESGKFSLTAAQSDVLVVSAIGFALRELKVTDIPKSGDIVLEEHVSELDQAIVVGYGTQKVQNLTGSVGNVSGVELTKRPSPNIQNLLQGRVSGLNIVQGSGQPGRDNASILIRGRGSFGASSAPLVLVNGVIGSMENLSPSDIAEVTVLKDAASAAIYGARAANGVILITTKSGKKGQNTIEYGTSVGTSTATRLPDLVTNSALYMEMRNTARVRNNQPAMYTQAQIDEYKNATDRTRFPNFDWVDYAFNRGSTMNHNLSLSGGSEKTTYNVSLNTLRQNGIIDHNDYKRYNALMDFKTQINKSVSIGANVNFSNQKITEPWLVNDNLVLLIYHSSPLFSPYLPDGSGRIAASSYVGIPAGNRSFQTMMDGGKTNSKYNIANAQGFVNVQLLKGLLWQVKGAFTYDTREVTNRQYATPEYYFQPDATGQYAYSDDGYPYYYGVNQSNSKSVTSTVYSTLTYEKQLGKHHYLNVLAGYEQQQNHSASLMGQRIGFPNNSLNELNAGSASGQITGGTATEWALQSFFGRANYAFKNKYLLEVNARYDGTSRVAAQNRWGLFSSASAGWKLSEENFIKESLPWVDNLKLRASLGTLGNQEILIGGQPAYYPYQDILGIAPYPFNGNLQPGATITRLIDKNLQWEVTKVADVGLDIDIKGGLFGATVDWFDKNTTGILTTRQDVPSNIGLAPPTTNAGAMQNRGWEIELRHQNRLGEFTYGANFIVSSYTNKVTKVLAPNPGVFEVGRAFNSYFLYEMAGVFQSQQEIDSSPKQPNSGILKPGDIRIKDRSGNGTIGPEDRFSVNPFPAYTYSFGLNAGWKGFALSAFFQGVQGQKFQVSGWGFDPFTQESAPDSRFLNAWTPENPSNTVPAIYSSGYPGVNGYTSTYSLLDASYLRLKNVYLSYSLPQKVMEKVHSKGLTVYLSGDNLVTFTKYQGTDPELLNGGRYARFPQLKTFTAGLNIKF